MTVISATMMSDISHDSDDDDDDGDVADSCGGENDFFLVSANMVLMTVIANYDSD